MTNDTALSLSALPFQPEVFHTFGGNAKARRLLCDVFDAKDVTPEAASDLLDQLAGMDSIKDKIKNLTTARVDLFRQAVRAALGQAQEKKDAPSQGTSLRRNIILRGPTGVGKTVTAQAVAVYMVANKLVANPRITMLKGLDLRGEFVGETNVIVNKIFEFSRQGVVILDEADSLASYDNTSFDIEAINQLNACIEAENKAGTVAIITGYANGIEALFLEQPGLRERFPAMWDIEKYDATQIGRVFDKKLEQEGLRIESSARDMAHRELLACCDNVGDKFGNSRTIERFINMIITSHASQFSETRLETIATGESHEVNDLLTVTMTSIPQFDKKNNDFVNNRPRLHVVGAAVESVLQQH